MASVLAKHTVSTFARIAPYLPHPLQTAPQAIALHLLNPSNNVPWYKSYSHFYTTASDPFHTVLPLLGTAIIGSYVMSVVMRNVSQVDRMWTTFPVIYSLHFALFPLLNKNGAAFAHNLPRVWLMVAMQVSGLGTRRLKILNVFARSCGVYDSLTIRLEGVSTACERLSHTLLPETHPTVQQRGRLPVHPVAEDGARMVLPGLFVLLHL